MYLNIKTSRMRLSDNLLWLFMALFLPLTSGEKFEGDSCNMRTTSGVCKLASECPELESAVRSGRFSTRDIVNCGYTTREEIICCPSDVKVTTENRSDDKFIFEQTLITTSSTSSTTTTTSPTSTDFWAHLLTTTQSTEADTTTAKPDFWAHLLITTTTTTTPLPIVVNGKKVDADTEFIDLSALLSQNDRRAKNNAAIEMSEQRAVESDSLQQRSTPNSVNHRTFGWQGPPIGIPTQRTNLAVPSPRQWNSGSMHNFEKNDGMPFLDTWRKSPVEQPNIQLFEPARQSNVGWPNQQESPIPMPVMNPSLSQHRRLSSQSIAQNAWSRPNQGVWPSNTEDSRFNGRTNPQWQHANEVSPTNTFVENFGPTNSAVKHQNMFNRQPSILPNRPFWGRDSAESQPINIKNNMEDPIAIVNENFVKSGLEIIKVNANEIGREYEKRKTNFDDYPEELSATPHARVSDIYKPFQFRPQPNDDDNIIDRGSKDFRFPGVTEKRPNWNFNQSRKPDVGSVTPRVPLRNSTTISPRTKERPAAIACREIDADLDPGLSFHILGGTPVELEEFPHMAAIGYSSIGNNEGPYEYNCGGTLIAKRFVLTAAHCVNSRDNQPEVVLLGLVDINSSEQRENADEVKIRKIHIHDDYSSSSTYNDVAILELEREVVYSKFIYPACLYTDLNDPPPKFPVYVSGWGRINVGSRQKSNILLKAKLNVVPVSRCNASYVEMGLNRRINVGVTNSQLCANDPGLTKDACQGDSGGPLILVEDEAYRKYRIIGIISAGFSCGSITPGLYARVASYLDYIESIVWPNLA